MNQFKKANQLMILAMLILLSFAGCRRNEPISSINAQSDSSPKGGKLATQTLELMSGNPVLPVYTADPDILYANGKYYIYNTAGGSNVAQFHAWSSSDLLTWTDEGIIFDLGPDCSWANSDGWAPCVVARNGKYYFYYTAGGPSNAKIGVAWSTSPTGHTTSNPTGHFIDKGSPLASSTVYDAIDPMVFVDTDGQAYMYWGNSTLAIHRLTADMMNLTGTTSYNKPSNYFEAPYVIKRNTTYYLFYSVNPYTSDDYHVEYAVSYSPLGPWTTRGRLTSPGMGIYSPGHNAILRRPGCSDEYYFVYASHTTSDANARHTCIDRMFFNTSNGAIFPINLTTSGVTTELPTTPCYPKQPIANGVYYIASKKLTAAGDTLYLNRPGCSNNNGNVDVWTKLVPTCLGQRWKVEYQGNGFYKFISEQPAHDAMEVLNGGLLRGTDVVAGDLRATEWQLFRIEPVSGGYYRIISHINSNAVGLTNAQNSAGTNVYSWSWNGTDQQLWKFVP